MNATSNSAAGGNVCKSCSTGVNKQDLRCWLCKECLYPLLEKFFRQELGDTTISSVSASPKPILDDLERRCMDLYQTKYQYESMEDRLLAAELDACSKSLPTVLNGSFPQGFPMIEHSLLPRIPKSYRVWYGNRIAAMDSIEKAKLEMRWGEIKRMELQYLAAKSKLAAEIKELRSSGRLGQGCCDCGRLQMCNQQNLPLDEKRERQKRRVGGGGQVGMSRSGSRFC